MTTKRDSKSLDLDSLTLETGRRLKEERLRLGLKATDFENHGGWPASTVYGWESGKSSPKSEFYATTASLGFDIPYIITGKRSQNLSAPVMDVLAPRRAGLTGPAPKPAHSEDTLYIPLLSATGSMGPGTEALAADVVMGDVPISLIWVQMNLPRSRPEALRLVHAYGDSMRGTLESGDFALVDTDIHSVDIDGVYVLEAHQRLFIKRVRQRMDGRYEISSDNPAIKQTDILNGGHEVRICGMVVYGWNGRRF
ncbi:helix-turn-helix transcriptional regulator [Comamonas piscis]|uniref:Helix-turn-helix transcriptional regulator n=1 Tax=Comamonas piscis TaxID=1562974 RepID=A0A7G5ELY3_9BURK|nr:XRE family transcriptional regulator [Comamonas piscis]QMV75008.1 helix-turn-helix transcriptional regulator [Comamonas piscis]WSO33488.1 S24 family peptidase [Comamonas piscis]